MEGVKVNLPSHLSLKETLKKDVTVSVLMVVNIIWHCYSYKWKSFNLVHLVIVNSSSM